MWTDEILDYGIFFRRAEHIISWNIACYNINGPVHEDGGYTLLTANHKGRHHKDTRLQTVLWGENSLNISCNLW